MTAPLIEQPEFLSMAEVARLFRCTQETIKNWIKKGTLPAPLAIGGKKLFRAAEVRKLLEPKEAAE